MHTGQIKKKVYPALEDELMFQVKQIIVKLMLCYVSYCGRKSIGCLPVYIKYKWIKRMC